MVAEFNITDHTGAALDLAEQVAAKAAEITSSERAAEALFDGSSDRPRIVLRACKVRVCTKHQLPGSSHTGRQLETETEGRPS